MAPPTAGRPTTAGLYSRHWPFVLQVLHSFDVENQDLEDVAQTVFQHVHTQIATYDPERHTSERAWLTGFARNCAKNHRRRTSIRRMVLLQDDAGERLPAAGIDPEQSTILQELRRVIPNEGRLEVFVLRFRHEMTIEEIAAALEISPSTVKTRLQLAKEDVEADKPRDSGEIKKDSDDVPKSGAYLGYGSLEELAKALRPERIPPERGVELWKRIEKAIQEGEGKDPDGRSETAPSSAPVVPALSPVPALVPGAPQVALTLAKTKLAGLVAAVMVIAAAPGVSGHDARQPAEAYAEEAPAPQETAPAMAASSREVAAEPSVAPPRSALPRAAPVRLAAKRPTTESDPSRSLIQRMQRAFQVQELEGVLALADQHERRFAGDLKSERETLRLQALIQLGRSDEAERHARATVAAHPRLRLPVERVIGHALP